MPVSVTLLTWLFNNALPLISVTCPLMCVSFFYFHLSTSSTTALILTNYLLIELLQNMSSGSFKKLSTIYLLTYHIYLIYTEIGVGVE